MLSLAVLASTAAPASLTTRGAVLKVFDPKTRSKVTLVGCMHFNPRSIQLAREVVEEEAATGRLRAVAVESCPTRWNATLDAQPTGSFLRSLCDNEMQSAAEAGEACGVNELVLADQTIEDTGKRVAQLFALTFVELLTPWAGGWNRIYEDFQNAFAQVGGEGLKADALLDPRLVVGFPVSLVRYPLSLGLKSPAFGALLACIFFLVNQDVPADDSLEDLFGALAFTAVETIVLGRVLLVGLLEERNYVLARNIRKACLAKPGGSVVAILGMAHCTGVGKILRESRLV